MTSKDSKQDEHRCEWRAYGQPDGFVVCDGCNFGIDVNVLITQSQLQLLDRLLEQKVLTANNKVPVVPVSVINKEKENL